MKNYNSKKLALNLINSIHGSGIDCDYAVSENRHNLLLHNSYHCMDEYGGYDGFCDFTVKIDKKTAKVKNIVFHTTGYYYRKYVWMLKDYLEQLFFDPIFHEYETAPYYLNKWNVK